MPEFIMNDEDSRGFQGEIPFVQGFIEAMFFTECSPAYDSDEWFTSECIKAQEDGQADGTIPGDAGYLNLTPSALAEIREFCERKQAEMEPLLEQAYERDYTEEQAGSDLWFTFNGHGVGYWSREELEEGDLGRKLSNVCGRGEILLFAQKIEDDFTVSVDIYGE